MNLTSLRAFRDELMKIAEVRAVKPGMPLIPKSAPAMIKGMTNEGAQLGSASDAAYAGLGGTGDSLSGAHPTAS